MQIWTRRRWPSDTRLRRQARSISSSRMSLRQQVSRHGRLNIVWHVWGRQGGRVQGVRREVHSRAAQQGSLLSPLGVHALHTVDHLPRRNVALQATHKGKARLGWGELWATQNRCMWRTPAPPRRRRRARPGAPAWARCSPRRRCRGATGAPGRRAPRWRRAGCRGMLGGPGCGPEVGAGCGWLQAAGRHGHRREAQGMRAEMSSNNGRRGSALGWPGAAGSRGGGGGGSRGRRFLSTAHWGRSPCLGPPCIFRPEPAAGSSFLQLGAVEDWLGGHAGSRACSMGWCRHAPRGGQRAASPAPLAPVSRQRLPRGSSSDSSWTTGAALVGKE